MKIDRNNGWYSGGGIGASDTTPRQLTLSKALRNASQRAVNRKAHGLAETSPDAPWFWQIVKLEVERARRRDLSFTILAVRQVPSSGLKHAAETLRPHLRHGDAALAERDQLLVVLSETGASEAAVVIDRLSRQVVPELRDSPWLSVEFPRHALTLGSLIDAIHDPEFGERLRLAG